IARTHQREEVRVGLARTVRLGVARTVAELRLGPLTPLAEALPEVTKGAGRCRNGRLATAGPDPKTTIVTTAEGARVELAGRLPAHMISSHAPSATRSPLLRRQELARHRDGDPPN